MKRLATLMLLLASGSTWAMPVTWSLDGVTFDDGAIATGQFTFDADTNIYSDVAISVDGGSGFFAFQAGPVLYDGVTGSFFLSFSNPAIVSPSSAGVTLNRPGSCGFEVCRTELTLVYASELTNGGGIVALASGLSHEKICPYSQGCLRDSNDEFDGYRAVIGGSLVATVVPVPAAVWLFLSALMALGFSRKATIAA